MRKPRATAIRRSILTGIAIGVSSIVSSADVPDKARQDGTWHRVPDTTDPRCEIVNLPKCSAALQEEADSTARDIGFDIVRLSSADEAQVVKLASCWLATRGFLPCSNAACFVYSVFPYSNSNRASVDLEVLYPDRPIDAGNNSSNFSVEQGPDLSFQTMPLTWLGPGDRQAIRDPCELERRDN